ncbi:uncharacterized protein LOC130898999 [Diorhabda carinulata]|uniref:uncharacterized protein LOC130443322 n=1 Tax=Diorhabda sublineata TaxID=1163346 RepID=UPI0024E124BF|nr:uncharacterized protein LOC130443322 [Diorhabda sublineata]XP_057664633.1 uncharacterized protein LOC130898999 [Diorhabda carinulata]
MNVLLTRHAAKYIYCIPEGLRELMTDISREVLRSQPENMYLFIADYLEALLITRENARIAARMVQSITEIAEATVEFLQQSGLDKPQVDKIVEIIHEAFKKRIRDDVITIQAEQQTEEIEEANIIADILEQAEIPSDLAEESAKIIQQAYRKFKTRKQMERQLLSGIIDWRIAARSAIRLYRQTGVTNEEANRAATLIKAAYKGYYTRRIMKKLKDEQKFLHPMLEEEEVAIEPEEAQEFDFEYKQMYSVDSKTVKIDYDTVIPHVDFGDVTTAEAAKEEIVTQKKESTPSAIISYALDKILDNVMKKSDQNYAKIAVETPPPESEEPKDEIWHVENYLEEETEGA